MSLNKAIRYGKEHRKGYYGAKAVDPLCRNNKGCSYCEKGRQHKNKKRKMIYDETY